MIGLAIVSFMLGSAIAFMTARVSVRTCGNIRYKLFYKIQNLTDAEIDKFSTPSLITRVTNDITFYQNTLVLMFRMLLRSVMLFIGGVIASFIYSSQLKASAEFSGQNL